MVLLKLNNIKKSFNKKEVLNELNLVVNKGECIYIHGKNGCGKSTLFKIICDILNVDLGTLEISDEVHLGALIENPGFIESESIKFNLHFLASLKKNYDEEKIIELCNIYSLDYFDKSKLKSYSVGMRQKVGIIQAVMENQNLILFDEPTRGLDDDSIKIFENMVNDLVNDGKTIIIASHDLLPNISYSHKYLLDKGKLFLDEKCN